MKKKETVFSNGPRIVVVVKTASDGSRLVRRV